MARARSERKVRRLSFGRFGAAIAALAGLCLLFLGPGAAAQQNPDHDLASRLTPEVLATVFPDADRIGPTEGDPPAAAVYKGDEVVAYIFSTLDVVAAPGYSGVPFDVIAAVDTQGTLSGATVVFHKEPYVIREPIRQVKLDGFLADHRDLVVGRVNVGAPRPDIVAGATISARAMRVAIFDTARLILRDRVNRPVVTEPTLDRVGFRLASVAELLDEGSVTRRTVSNAEIATMFTEQGGAGAVPEEALGAPDGIFSDVYTALLNPPSIGRNLLGAKRFKGYLRKWPQEGHIVVVAADGDYGKGNISQAGWCRSTSANGPFHHRAQGNMFDRLQIAQGEKLIRFHRDNSQSVVGMRGIARRCHWLFYLPEDSGFDPLAPWRLNVLVSGKGPGGPVTIDFDVPYKLPARHILMPETEPVPAWVEAWRDDTRDVAILGVALLALTTMLAFQTPLARRPRLHRWLRNGFLAFILVWLGWIAGGQLTILNLVNYLTAPVNNVGWGFYMAEPLIVVIAVYTAISLILLGRGVFCGWLCPFGALQELLGQISRLLRLPQWTPGAKLNQYLWLGKYVAAVVVLGLAFISMDWATAAAEIEPFKTAITAKFERSWPFVVYAAALLSIGLFTERAFCRYLCPLGGALAILGRFPLLKNLKRRAECGSPCKLCELSCPVKAIVPGGQIKMGECFQCLDCQVEYYNDHRCPPLAQARKRRERSLAGALRPAPIAPGPMHPVAAD